MWKMWLIIWLGFNMAGPSAVTTAAQRSTVQFELEDDPTNANPPPPAKKPTKQPPVTSGVKAPSGQFPPTGDVVNWWLTGLGVVLLIELTLFIVWRRRRQAD